jgi:hypothetical protein
MLLLIRGVSSARAQTEHVDGRLIQSLLGLDHNQK